MRRDHNRRADVDRPCDRRPGTGPLAVAALLGTIALAGAITPAARATAQSLTPHVTKPSAVTPRVVEPAPVGAGQPGDEGSAADPAPAPAAGAPAAGPRRPVAEQAADPTRGSEPAGLILCPGSSACGGQPGPTPQEKHEEEWVKTEQSLWKDFIGRASGPLLCPYFRDIVHPLEIQLQIYQDAGLSAGGINGIDPDFLTQLLSASIGFVRSCFTTRTP